MRLSVIITIILALQGCATTPITREHWRRCQNACAPLPVKEACVSMFGFGDQLCTCESGETLEEYLETYGL
jgi:hypothetical protein